MCVGMPTAHSWTDAVHGFSSQTVRSMARNLQKLRYPPMNIFQVSALISICRCHGACQPSATLWTCSHLLVHAFELFSLCLRGSFCGAPFVRSPIILHHVLQKAHVIMCCEQAILTHVTIRSCYRI